MQTLTMKLLLSLNKDLYRALADEADIGRGEDEESTENSSFRNRLIIKDACGG